MNPSLQEFLNSRLPLPGISGWALFSGERVLARESSAEWLPPDKIEKAATSLVLFTRATREQRLQSFRLCWTFEHLRVHVATARSGVCLMVFQENRPEGPGEILLNLLEDFANLNL